MPTPNERAAINLIVEFLLHEFTLPEAASGVIANLVTIVNAIIAEYNDPDKNYLNSFYIARNPRHVYKMLNFIAQMQENKSNESFRSIGSLEKLLLLLQQSDHWGAPNFLQALRDVSIESRGAINYRVVCFLIERSKSLAPAACSEMIDKLPLLNDVSIRNYFFMELTNGIASKKSKSSAVAEHSAASSMQNSPSANRVSSLGVHSPNNEAIQPDANPRYTPPI